MSRARRPSSPLLVVVERDPAAGRALVTGSPAAERAAVMVARDARWSPRARGWVIDDPADVLNLRGYAQLRRLVLVERVRGGAHGAP